MQVVLLAAGLGKRLGALTERLPKALVTVAGEALVAHALRFAARLGPAQVVVVGGYGFTALASEIARLRAAGTLPTEVRLVENPRFLAGNLRSLLVARPLVDQDFLLLNVDHIFGAPIAHLVRPPVQDVTAFIDTDRRLGADDMKVVRDARGQLRRISKTLATWDAGYVGMTRVPASALDRYFGEADAALAAEGPQIHVERVLARLCESEAPPLCRDISGHTWLEVDTPQERTRAEEALRGPGWS